MPQRPPPIDLARESTALMPKIKGRFCERAIEPKKRFDARSFRWKRSGTSWVLIGCPRRKWDAKNQRCKVGTRAYRVLQRSTRGVCCPNPARGDKCVHKNGR